MLSFHSIKFLSTPVLSHLHTLQHALCASFFLLQHLIPYPSDRYITIQYCPHIGSLCTFGHGYPTHRQLKASVSIILFFIMFEIKLALCNLPCLQNPLAFFQPASRKIHVPDLVDQKRFLYQFCHYFLQIPGSRDT